MKPNPNKTSWTFEGVTDNGIEKLESYTLTKASDIFRQKRLEEKKARKLEWQAKKDQVSNANGSEAENTGQVVKNDKAKTQKRGRPDDSGKSTNRKKAKPSAAQTKQKPKGNEKGSKELEAVEVQAESGLGPRKGAYGIQNESEDVESVEPDLSEANDDAEDDGLCDDYDVPEHMGLWQTLLVPKPIIKALEDMKFTIPTPIQMLTLPAAIHGHRDVIGAAETGSGKTLVFGIPILHGIINDREWDKKKLKSEEEEEDSEDGSITSDGNLENLEPIEGEGGEEVDFEGVEDLELNENFDEDAEADNIIDVGWCPASDEPVAKLQRKLKPFRALILTPTRELAVQIKNHLTVLAKYTKAKIAVVIGGMSQQKQERVLNQGPEIVIATPGRLWELIQEGNAHLSQIANIRYLAIDETDRMLERGHFQELQNLLEILNRDPIACKKRQTFILSATLTVVHSMPERLTQKSGAKFATPTVEVKLENLISMVGVKHTAKKVDLTRESVTAESLLETRIFCELEEKDFYLFYFTQEHPGRTLVFLNSIDAVRRLTTIFALLRCRALPLHAELHQKQRLKNLERFTSEKNCVLIATDVAARGLDIPDVQNVIHYQVPRTSESYVHRSGRTARASKEGLSVVLVSPAEMTCYRSLLKTLKVKGDLPAFPVNEGVMSDAKLRVNLARSIDKLEHRARKQQASNSWFRKVAEEAEMEIDDHDLIQDMGDSFEQAKFKKELKSKRMELASLLSQPMKAKGHSAKYITKAGPTAAHPLSGTGNSQTALDALKNGKRPQKPVSQSKNASSKRKKFGGNKKKKASK